MATVPEEQSQVLPQQSDRKSIVVIGGGVVGAATAYYLSEAGCDVTIIDKGDFGQGCSHGNCGYVSPSHVFPLCKPGMIGSTFKTLLQSNSPLRIQFRLDPAFWSWMLRFAGNCNKEHMYHAGAARHALLHSSRALYGDLIDSGILPNSEWKPRGLIFVFKSQQTFEHHEEIAGQVRETFGVDSKPFAGQELNDLEPALKTGIAGGWLYDCDAHLRPDRLMQAWRQALELRGVTIKEHCEFQGWEVSSGLVSAVKTSQGSISAEEVVVATGAWTPLLKQQIGMRLPIEPGKGYSLTMDRPTNCPSYPMLFEEHRVGVTPMQTGFRIGSTMEFVGHNSEINPKRLKLLTDGARLYLRDPIDKPVLERWAGWRPMSCDGIPMIGRIPKLKNAWAATGHSMLGLSMSTATGKLVKEMICGETPHVDPEPYRIDRF